MSEVRVLCADCHKETEMLLRQWRRCVASRLTKRDLRILTGALAVAYEQHEGLAFSHAVAALSSDADAVRRLAESWRPAP